ncbi:hypothetical protein CLV46_1380 [Diaminobutyricimonas aerilata]|uniref:DUF5709 domain-containing protein n=1 Tax=Diaminobutyricimonas aerilata TaxID=1162967 RepID=A0A2M9CIV8_9MICO|nr:hypothetical protein [Diaminobutyricimonas aerilata]PJJ71827.1 hypothetical protein CLV46_1380 [Diaminobutyricimonas aerilata]
MSDSEPTPSFGEVSTTDAITGTNAGSALDASDSAGVTDAAAAVDAEMSGTDLSTGDRPNDVAGDDSSEREEGDVGLSGDAAPSTSVSDVDLDESDAIAGRVADDADDSGGDAPLADDAVEDFRFANDLVTNDAVAGETVLDEDAAPVEGAPYAAENELHGDVQLDEEP